MTRRLLPLVALLVVACSPKPGNPDAGPDGGSLQPPELTSISPAKGAISGGTLVTVNGTGFVDGITVFFAGQPGTEVLVATRAKLTVRTPAGAALGPADVKVTNPDGQSATLTRAFTYEADAITAIDEALVLNPLEGADTSGANPVAVTVVAHVSVPSLTKGAGQGQGIVAQVGHATTLSSPPAMSDFTWVAAAYSGDADSEALDKRFDAYRGNVMLPGANGAEEKTFYLAARFSMDGNVWVMADRDGLANGLAATQVPKLTVSRPTIDWCKLGGQVVEAPPDVKLKVGQTGPTVYAQVYAAGVTPQAGAGAGIKAQLGYGASASDLSNWTWADATYNVDTNAGANDEYQATLPNPGAGQYAFAYRVSLNNGPFRYCDANGLAEGGFTPEQAGRLSVSTANIDECKLLGPSLAVAVPSGKTVALSARVLASTITDSSGQGGNITGEVGYGPLGTQPDTWTTWTAAAYSADQGTFDVYAKSLTAPAMTGTYDVAFRFQHMAKPFVYCDLDGSANGYASSQAAHLSVGQPAIQSCRLVSVDKATVASGRAVVAHARVIVPGVSEGNGAPANVRAQVGVGTAGTDASAGIGWGWKEAAFGSDVPSSAEDDFVVTFQPAYTGDRAVAFRFTLDNGASWTYCDTNGSDVGGYEVEQQPALTVTPAEDPSYCNLQFPSTLSLSASQVGNQTGVVYGRVFHTGVTEAAGAHASVKAEVGFAPSASKGADPGVSADWSWLTASYNVQVMNDDEYQATFGPADAGTYTYAFRVTRTDGGSYCYGDLDGAGSAGGFNGEAGAADNLGKATVIP